MLVIILLVLVVGLGYVSLRNAQRISALEYKNNELTTSIEALETKTKDILDEN